MPSRKKNTITKSLGDPLNPELSHRSRTRNQADKRTNAQEYQAASIAKRNDLIPNLQVVMRSVTELIPYARMLRKASTDDVLEMANVISDATFVSPITIGRDGRTILDGELRVRAAHWLQLEEVPCILLEHLTPGEERKIRLALNRMGQRRTWQFDELKLELEELVIAEESIELLGFDKIELDQILYEDEGCADPVSERASYPTVVKDGDVWRLGTHRLICGDATLPDTYDALLGDEQAQLLLTDPPYNIAVSTIVSTKHEEFAQASGEMSPDEFVAFLSAFLSAAQAPLLDGAIAFVFMDWRQIEILMRVARECGYGLLNFVAWVKANAGMGSFYRSQHELVLVLKKPGEHKNRIKLGAKGRNRANVWFAPGAGTLGTDSREMLEQHPTSKPVQMLVDAVIDVTDPGDIILDAFGGSGSTLMAAERSKRRARLIELDPDYCGVIIRRWQKQTGEDAVLERTGQTYAKVAATRAIEDAKEGDQAETGKSIVAP